MDYVSIKNLEVFANHGVYKEEVALGQKFVVSVQLFYDMRKAGQSDRLDYTINYAEACNLIVDFMRKNTFSLVETVAEHLATKLLLNYEIAKKVTVEVKKPWAPIGLPLESVSVIIERGWHDAYISIGSNIGDRRKMLDDAIATISAREDTQLVKSAEYIETKPYGNVDQDDFLNGLIKIRTLLTPYELLDVLHETENAAGRERTIHWGPRTLDLDIIFYDECVIGSDELVVPHVDMHNRAFVLEPMCEIAPNHIHPVYQKTMRQLLDELNA